MRLTGLLIATVATVLLPVTSYADGTRQKSDIIIPESRQISYDRYGYAPAIKLADGTIYVSGVIAGLSGDGSYDERYIAGFKQALAHIEMILKEAGANLDDVVDITTYHTDIARQIEPAVKARMDVMAPPHPTWTAIGISSLATPDGVTEIRVIARISED